MRATFVRLADALRASYWFIPGLMALGAVILAGAMIVLDTYKGSEWMDGLPWLYAARPNGARLVLSAIGASMITVAGTVFSVTIAAVVYASGQYGPRLLSNFMSDRGNQVTLGTFIGTFVYCLLVLRTIRSSDEVAGAAGFVPNLALLVAVILAICSIAVLIFFIHHVPSKLHINSVIEEVGHKLVAGIEHRFPVCVGAPSTPREQIPGAEAEGLSSAAVLATHTGYIQFVDDEALMACAERHHLMLHIYCQPGDFTHVGRTLAEATPAYRCGSEISANLATAFAVGARRSALQDLDFLIDELVEIGARALSPGVNDPFTAVTCLDWLGAALSDLSCRETPSRVRLDKGGVPRVVARPATFDDLLDRSLGGLIQYCSADMIAAQRFVRVLAEIALSCDDPARRSKILVTAGQLEVLSRRSIAGVNLERVQACVMQLREAFAAPDYKRALRDSPALFGPSP